MRYTNRRSLYLMSRWWICGFDPQTRRSTARTPWRTDRSIDRSIMAERAALGPARHGGGLGESPAAAEAAAVAASRVRAAKWRHASCLRRGTLPPFAGGFCCRLFSFLRVSFAPISTSEGCFLQSLQPCDRISLSMQLNKFRYSSPCAENYGERTNTESILLSSRLHIGW